MAGDIDGVLKHTDDSRRDFLRRLIAGAAFAPPLLASFSLDGLSLASAQTPIFPNQCFVFVSNATNVPTGFCFDFSDTQYEDNFVDILRSEEINAGADVGGTGHTALNIRGRTGSGGSTWATILAHRLNPGPKEIVSGFIDQSLSADILTHRFDNSKGVGLLALAFALDGEKGLGLVVSNAGNSDKLQLMTVDIDGKVVPLKSVSLGAGIAEDAWYRLTMQIRQVTSCLLPGGVLQCFTVPDVQVIGRVFRHEVPTDPNSKLGLQVGATLDFSLDLNLISPVFSEGIVARAVNAIVDSSVTNFCANCGVRQNPV